jgi:hypothetical protein
MRLAGAIPEEVLTLIARAGEDESSWPSILKPVPRQVPDYKYDEHMQQHVPNIPLKPA